MNISIHAPRTGSDGIVASYRALGFEFQSTLPARGATDQHEILHRLRLISIHAPRTGSDWMDNDYDQHPEHFNPRSPHGERRLSPLRLLR